MTRGSGWTRKTEATSPRSVDFHCRGPVPASDIGRSGVVFRPAAKRRLASSRDPFDHEICFSFLELRDEFLLRF
jgi:hypothetical protein